LATAGVDVPSAPPAHSTDEWVCPACRLWNRTTSQTCDRCRSSRYILDSRPIHRSVGWVFWAVIAATVLAAGFISAVAALYTFVGGLATIVGLFFAMSMTDPAERQRRRWRRGWRGASVSERADAREWANRVLAAKSTAHDRSLAAVVLRCTGPDKPPILPPKGDSDRPRAILGCVIVLLPGAVAIIVSFASSRFDGFVDTLVGTYILAWNLTQRLPWPVWIIVALWFTWPDLVKDIRRLIRWVARAATTDVD